MTAVEVDRLHVADVHAAHLHVGVLDEPLAGGVEAGDQLVAGVEVPEGELDADRRQGRHQHQGAQAADDVAQAGGELHPEMETVLPPPHMTSDMMKFRTTTLTIDRRIARPTATPTPAGPPLAV